MRLRLALVLIICAATLVTCKGATSIMLHIDSDMRLGRDIDEVRVTVTVGDDEVGSDSFDLTTDLSLPQSLALTPGSRASGNITIHVAARNNNDDVLVVRRDSRFVDGEERAEEVCLYNSCVGSSDSFCEEGRCREVPADGDADSDGDGDGDIWFDENTERCVTYAAYDESHGWEVEGARILTDSPYEDVITIDMSGLYQLELAVRICDPTNRVLDLADSPSCNGDGGAVDDTTHSAELEIINSYFVVSRSQLAAPSEEAYTFPNFVAPTGCTQQMIYIRDQEVASPTAGFETSSESFLRIDPPTDELGTPDGLWYLAPNKVITGVRWGTGLEQAWLCLW